MSSAVGKIRARLQREALAKAKPKPRVTVTVAAPPPPRARGVPGAVAKIQARMLKASAKGRAPTVKVTVTEPKRATAKIQARLMRERGRARPVVNRLPVVEVAAAPSQDAPTVIVEPGLKGGESKTVWEVAAPRTASVSSAAKRKYQSDKHEKTQKAANERRRKQKAEKPLVDLRPAAGRLLNAAARAFEATPPSSPEQLTAIGGGNIYEDPRASLGEQARYRDPVTGRFIDEDDDSSDYHGAFGF